MDLIINEEVAWRLGAKDWWVVGTWIIRWGMCNVLRHLVWRSTGYRALFTLNWSHWRHLNALFVLRKWFLREEWEFELILMMALRLSSSPLGRVLLILTVFIPNFSVSFIISALLRFAFMIHQLRLISSFLRVSSLRSLNYLWFTNGGVRRFGVRIGIVVVVLDPC